MVSVAFIIVILFDSLFTLHSYASVDGQLALFDSNFPLQNGISALMWASVWGHLQVVERILAAGAQPDLQDNVRIASECTQLLAVTLSCL